MAKILGIQDFIKVLPWCKNQVTVLVGPEGTDGYNYRVDLDHAGASELIDALSEAMADNDNDEVSDEDQEELDAVDPELDEEADGL